MKKIILISLFCLYGQTAFAVCDSDCVYNLIVDYMDSRVQEIACDQRVEVADALCLDDQQRKQTDFYNKGQFRSELNQRNQEAVYTLAFLYQEPESTYYLNSNVLNRVLFGLDYLRRAQGEEGGISEDGWQGIDYNDVDCDGEKNERSIKNNPEENPPLCDCDEVECNNDEYKESPSKGNGTSVSGFTYYAAAQAINLLEGDPTYENRIDNLIAIGGDGVENDPRNEAYSYLITKAANYLTNGGRGHAPNQDAVALLALHALNGAYDRLGYAVPDAELDTLMDQLDLDEGDAGFNSKTSLSYLRDEIFWGNPDQAFDGAYGADFVEDADGDGGNGFNRWFTDQALLLEKGYKAIDVNETDSHSAGYDGNYSWVALRMLALLRDWDLEFDASDFVEDYVNWFQYFFYVDLNLKKGGYQVSAIARRTWQDGQINLPVSGLLQDQPAMKTIFNATLEHFVANSDSYFSYEDDSLFKGFYVIGDFLQHWVEPTWSDYVLPLNKNPVNFSQYLDVQSDQAGANITLLEITDTGNDRYGVRYRVNDWWNGQKTYTYGDSYATITINGVEEAPCHFDNRGDDFYCCEEDTCCKQGDDNYLEGGGATLCEDLADCSPVLNSSCYDSGRVLEHVLDCNGCGDNEDLTLMVDVTEPEDAAVSVDPDNDGRGNYFDSDDDNDGVADDIDPNPIVADDDGDGYTEAQGDCNDGNNGQYQYPGLAETCGDGIDQNCDGVDPPCGGVCEVPAAGDWSVTANCLLSTTVLVSGNVTVYPNVVLTVDSIGVLDIDFLNHYLLIKNDGGVSIRSGGKIN